MSDRKGASPKGVPWGTRPARGVELFPFHMRHLWHSPAQRDSSKVSLVKIPDFEQTRRYDTERQRESDQLHLLVSLVKLSRQLRRSAGLDEAVIFATNIGREGGGFADLFPERFDTNMRLLQRPQRLADSLGTCAGELSLRGA